MTVVDAAGAKQIVEEGIPVIDVLSEESFEAQHLPGAINIPVDDPDFERRVREAVPRKDDRVMVYCSSTECEASGKAYRRLKEMGYRNAIEFESGLAGWRRAGHRFEGEGPKQVRAGL